MPDKSKFKVTYRHVPAQTVECKGFKDSRNPEGFIEFYNGGEDAYEVVYWAASEEVVSVKKLS